MAVKQVTGCTLHGKRPVIFIFAGVYMRTNLSKAHSRCDCQRRVATNAEVVKAALGWYVDCRKTKKELHREEGKA